MKILFLNHSDSLESLQGGQLSLVELVRRWQEHNSELEPVFISIGNRGTFADLCSENGWKCYVLPLDWWLETKGERSNSFRTSQYLSDLSSIFQVRQIIKEVNPSICFSNTITCPWLAYASVAEEVPHIWSCHESGHFNEELTFRYGYEETYKTIGDLSALVIANSLSTKDSLTTFMEPEKILHLAPVRSSKTLNALLSTSGQSIPAQEFLLSKSVFRIGCFGAVNSNKNQELLLKALEPIALSNRSFELVIAGNIDQEYWAMQKQKSFFSNIANNVVVLDSISNPLPLMASCDLVVSTSLYESFGMSIFEAQFAGVPVISTPNLGAFEIIRNGITGKILSGFEVEELSAAILDYMDSEYLVQSQGKTAAEYSKTYLKNSEIDRKAFFEFVETLSTKFRLPTSQSPLIALLNQAEGALPQNQMTKLSSMMGKITIQNKLSPSFIYRAIKSRIEMSK